MLETMIKALVSVLKKITPRVEQGWSTGLKKPYILWDFDGDGPEMRVNYGEVKYQAFNGTIDYFTDGDSNAVWIAMQDALNEMCYKFPGKFVFGKLSKQVEEREEARQSATKHLEWWFRMKA